MLVIGKDEQTVTIQFEHGQDSDLPRLAGLGPKAKDVSTRHGEEWQPARELHRLSVPASITSNLAW